MTLSEKPDWDKALIQLNSQVDGKSIAKQAELERELVAAYGEYKSKEWSKEVQDLLVNHERAIKTALSTLLAELGATAETYEYRGSFMAIGLSYGASHSYSAMYHPSSPEKAGFIYIVVNDMHDNGKTIRTFALPCTPPPLPPEAFNAI